MDCFELNASTNAAHKKVLIITFFLKFGTNNVQVDPRGSDVPVKDDKIAQPSADTMVWETHMSASKLLQPTRGFKEIRDSLFIAGARFGVNESEVQMEDVDFDFLSRRSRIGQVEKASLPEKIESRRLML